MSRRERATRRAFRFINPHEIFCATAQIFTQALGSHLCNCTKFPGAPLCANAQKPGRLFVQIVTIDRAGKLYTILIQKSRENFKNFAQKFFLPKLIFCVDFTIL
jgi:hypothetical protein